MVAFVTFRSVDVLQLNFGLERHFIMLIDCLRLCASSSVCVFHLYLLLKCTPSIFSDVSFCICMLPVDKVQLQLCFLQTCRCLHFVVESLAPEYSAQSRMVDMMGLRFMLIIFLFFSFSIKLKSSAYALRLMLG